MAGENVWNTLLNLLPVDGWVDGWLNEWMDAWVHK